MSASQGKTYAIGIDLGTSNSAACAYIDGKPVMITSDSVATAGKMLPSCVAFLKNGQVLVGATAKNQLITAPERTVYQSKRMMGTAHTWTIDEQQYRAEQVAACILRKIKSDAQQQLGGRVDQVVVTVPAQFNDAQRVATMDAIKIANLKLLRLINEPTAAAISYEAQSRAQQVILVVDIGGGTVDTTLLSAMDNVYDVIDTGGDTNLGGLDIDRQFMDTVVVKKLTDAYGKIPLDDKVVYQRIRDSTEVAKIQLSTLLSTNIVLPYLFKNDAGQVVSPTITVQRIELQTAMKPVLSRLETIIKKTIEAGAKTITKLILVGGPTQAPLVKETIERVVGITAQTGINPNHCVAIGAARQAAQLATTAENAAQGSSLLLLDVTPLSLGLEVQNNVTSVLIPRASKVPTSKTQKYTTATNNQTEVHIKVVQGERYKASDNHVLGQFTLRGIPPMKRGQAIINVTFEVDSSGVVSVSAEEETTKVKQTITIENSNRLDEAVIERMVKTAKENQRADQEYKQKVEVVHNAKTLMSRTEQLKSEKEAELKDFSQWTSIEQLVAEITTLVSAQIEKLETTDLKAKVAQCEKLYTALMQRLASSQEKGATDSAETAPQDSESQNSAA